MVFDFSLYALPLYENLYMVVGSGLIAVVFGIPLGFLLFLQRRIAPESRCLKLQNILINGLRSIPFILLVILLIPLTRLLTGSSMEKPPRWFL